ARNLLLGTKHDLWSVNEEQEYHEEIYGEDMDAQEVAAVVQKAVAEAFGKLDRLGFGLSIGITAGFVLFVATLWLVIKGGEIVGPTLALLGQFFPGYAVSPLGSVIGLCYAFTVGFIGGYLFALVRNAILFLWVAMIRKRAEREMLAKFLEYL
ncbi:MAG: hypothetical protein ACREBC_17405, partial [Pyrinomonadaceae bacterium]